MIGKIYVQKMLFFNSWQCAKWLDFHVQSTLGLPFTFHIWLIIINMLKCDNSLSTAPFHCTGNGGIRSFTHPSYTNQDILNLECETNAHQCGIFMYRIDDYIIEPKSGSQQLSKYLSVYLEISYLVYYINYFKQYDSLSSWSISVMLQYFITLSSGCTSTYLHWGHTICIRIQHHGIIQSQQKISTNELQHSWTCD